MHVLIRVYTSDYSEYKTTITIHRSTSQALLKALENYFDIGDWLEDEDEDAKLCYYNDCGIPNGEEVHAGCLISKALDGHVDIRVFEVSYDQEIYLP